MTFSSILIFGKFTFIGGYMDRTNKADNFEMPCLGELVKVE